MTKDVTTYVRLTEEQVEALERIASTNPLTNKRADHIRLAVDEYIQRHDEPTPQREADHAAA